jgi:hypothetical protein
MLPANYDSLINENPELKPAILRIRDWIREHRDWTILDPRILSRDMRDLDPWLLTLALQALIRKGYFSRVYRVVTPSGVLAEGDYDDPRSVPERIRDNWDTTFSREDADIVPVLKPAT